MFNSLLTLIFSCNRAMQLDGTLRSFFLHCQDAQSASMHVLYCATTPRHRAQYQQLAAEYNGVVFIEESHFRTDVLDVLWRALTQGRPALQRGWISVLKALRLPPALVEEPSRQQVLFGVDDNLFVQDFSLQAMTRLLEQHPDALGYSLRLGRNTTFCYPSQAEQELPDFSTLPEGDLKYHWAQADQDFAYPLELSSSLYRLTDMLRLVRRLPFRNPNELEGQMAARAGDFVAIWPALLCPSQSLTFCNPVNIVQTAWRNPAGDNPEYSSEHLADLFEQGYRIDVQTYSGLVPNGCHQVVPLDLYTIT